MPAEHGGRLVGELLEPGDVLAEDLDGQVGLDAGDQLVDAQRDRLREGEPHAREPAELLLHRRDELRPWSSPLVHSLRALSMISRSLCSGPIGSSEISARPVLLTTAVTSGNARAAAAP